MAPTKPEQVASKDASSQQLANGVGHSIAASPAARFGQLSDAEEATRRERFAFVLGLMMRQVIGDLGTSVPPMAAAEAIEEARREDHRVVDIIVGSTGNRPRLPPPRQEAEAVEEMIIDPVEEVQQVEATPLDQEVEEVVEGLAAQEAEESAASTSSAPTPRAPKRKLEEDPADKLYQKPAKVRSIDRSVRFSKLVSVQHRRQTLAICDRRPFVLTGSPTLEETQPLRRPSVHIRPRRFSRQAIEAMVAEADPETIQILEATPRPSGCQDSCPSGGCDAECSCVAQGLFCAPRYGCNCRPSTCSNYKNEPTTMSEHMKKRKEMVEAANRKTADWTEKDDSTISSVDSGEGDDEVAEVSVEDVAMEALESDDSVVVDVIGEGVEEAGVEEGNESMEEEEEDDLLNMAMHDEEEDDDDVQQYDNGDEFGMPGDWSPPPSPSNNQPQMDSTMRLSDEDEEDAAAADSSPSDSPSDESSSDPDDDDDDDNDSEDDNNDNRSPGFDMEPAEFSEHLLRQLPALLDQDEVDSCDAGQFLGGDALFVGLLRVATAAKQATGSKCAVCHPDVFEAAREVVEAEGRAVQGTGQLPILEPRLVKNFTAYGNNWNDLVIPMLLNNSHWAVAVVRRSLVSATVYDSSPNPASKGLVIAAVKKILAALVELHPEDKALARYKVKYSREGCRDVQKDGSSCGLFAINHTRRALARKNCSAAERAGDEPIDVAKERKELQKGLVELVAVFQQYAAMGIRWRHINGGQLPIRSARTLVTLTYNGRRQ